MYGLKQASVLAYENLVRNLKIHGYAPIPHTVGLWRHSTRPITFCLCVDDFGIKFENRVDAEHLLSSLRQFYSISTDWSGKNFCGLHLDWHYNEGYVDLSMPGYVDKVLLKFNTRPPQNHKRLHTMFQLLVPFGLALVNMPLVLTLFPL